MTQQDIQPARPGVWSWAPLPLLLAAMVVLWIVQPPATYHSPGLVMLLSLVFSTLVSLCLVFLIGRSFLVLGAPGLLLLGCGVLIWGLSSQVGNAVADGHANISVTIHNVSVWLSALCHLLGVILSFRTQRTIRLTRLWLATGYVLTLGAVGGVMYATLAGWLPTFFVQGQGGTLVRYFVLGSAIVMFILTAGLLRVVHRPSISPFIYWYSLAILLIAIGLFGTMIQPSLGSLIGWLGKAAQWFSGVYLLIAVIAVMRASRISIVALEVHRHETRYWYGISCAAVIAATVVRLAFMQELGTRVSYVTFYPAVMLAALYGGWRAGLLATLLSALVSVYFFIERTGLFSIDQPADWMGLLFFLLGGTMLAWITEAMHRARSRAYDAETHARLTIARQQDMDALRESEDRYRALAEATFEGIAMTEDGIVLEVNAQLAGMLGYTPEDMQGTRVDTFIHPDDYVLVQNRQQLSYELPYEHRMIHRDGSILIVEAHGKAIPYKGRQVRITALRDITARKQAEQALRESEERLRLALDAGRLAPWEINLVTQEVLPSPHLWALFAVTEETGLAFRAQWRARLHEDDREIVRKAVEQCADTGAEFNLQYRIRWPDGSVHWHESKGRPLADACGRNVRLVGVVADITERKQVEAERERLLTELQRQAAELEAVIMSQAHGMVIYSPSGEVVTMNQAAEAMLHYQPWERSMTVTERAIALQIVDQYGTPIPAEMIPIARALQGETTYGTVMALQRPDRILWVSVSAAPIHLADGQVLGAVATFNDISELVALQQQQQELLSRVQRQAAERDATITALADGMVIYDTNGAILYMNPAAEEILQYTDAIRAGSVAARVSAVRVEYDDGRPVPLDETPAWRAIHGESVQGMVVRFYRPDGSIHWYTNSAAPIRMPDGEIIGAVASFTDITALRELQEQMKTFIHLVSHDLRAPLTIMLGHVGLVQDRLAENQDRMLCRSVEAIGRAVKRMDTMIEDLVTAARMEGGQLPVRLTSVDLASWLPDFLERSAAVLDPQRILVDMPAMVPAFRADSDQLERILTNLISNALKYSSPGTPVWVRVQPHDDHLSILVEDQGQGIAPEHLPHLFEKFYRAGSSRQAEGIGLGLYITKLLVKALGGHISMDSEVGKGSTFSFTLNLLQQ